MFFTKLARRPIDSDIIVRKREDFEYIPIRPQIPVDNRWAQQPVCAALNRPRPCHVYIVYSAGPQKNNPCFYLHQSCITLVSASIVFMSSLNKNRVPKKTLERELLEELRARPLSLQLHKWCRKDCQ